MKLIRTISTTASALALTLLMGCGSSGIGDVLGGGNNPNYPNSGPSGYPSSASSYVQGTVNSVDTRNHYIDLSDTSGRRTTVYYDNRTQVSYRGQTGSPTQLERGDRVDVRLYDGGNGQYVADLITVTQSVSDNNTNYPNNGGYPSTSPYPSTYPSSTNASQIQGTVSYIDLSAQRIDLTSSYMNGLRNTQSGNGNYSVYFDNRTRVYYQNETHPVSDLERGDQIDVRLYNGNNGQAVADTITVVRNVRQ
jgi:hypothetical protein